MAGSLYFDDFRLDRSEAALWKGSERIPLKPKAFALLGFMAEHHGRLLLKRELLDTLWPDVHVTEAVLKVNVAELRQALGDTGRPARMIETVHRRGYRFLPAVREHSLPRALTRFIGREEALAQIQQALASERLITLTGAGGSGKTRLALEAAARAALRFRDGVRLVELAAARDDAGVPQGVASALGLHQHSDGPPLLEAIAAAIGGRELLLVLDNCEHVRGGAAALVESALARCPSLRVMATSREALDVSGERVVPVAPLAVPPSGERTAEELIGCDAVRLFVDRAEAGGAFRYDASTAAPVAAICRQLDGVPLAIELAAARTRVLGVAEIATRLRGSMGLLESARLRADGRHRSLEAALAWSLELLAEHERRLFAFLCVFAGGFSLRSAETVCSETGLGPEDVAAGVAALVAKSLVEATPAGADLRYRMLEPVRQIGEQRLVASLEAKAVRARHARHFQRLAEEAEPLLAGRSRPECLSRLSRELDNLRGALSWSASPDGEPAVGLATSASLLWFWFHRGLWAEGRSWLKRALDTGLGTEAARCQALAALGTLEFFGGYYADAAEHLEAACGGAAPRQSALAESFLGQVALTQGQPDRACERSRAGLEALRALGSGWSIGLALVNLGNALRGRGELGAARELYEESATVFRQVDDPWALAMALRNLGIVALRAGDSGTAVARFRESLAQLRGSAEPWFVSRGLEELATAIAEREPRRAAWFMGAAERLREQVGAPVVGYYRQAYEAGLEALRRGLPDGERRAAWADGRAAPTDAVLEEALREDPSAG